MTLQLLLAALIPPLVILLWLNRRGRPWTSIALAVFLGGACAEVAGLLEHVLMMKTWSITNFGMLFLFTTIVAGMVEELCKYAAFRIGPGRTRWFREEYDGVLYVAAVSLGFAAWENIGYVREHGMDTAVLRAYTAIPIHAACGIIMGSFIGRARVRQLHGWSTRGLAEKGILAAILLHGVYDMLAFSVSPITTWALYILDAAAVVTSIRLANAARRRSASFGGAQLDMPQAATPTTVRPAVVRPQRDERVAAVLGLIPGVGQAYNGEYRKGAMFLVILALNVALYGCLRAFVTDPNGSLAKLGSWGIALSLSEGEISSLLKNGQLMLAIMLGVIGAWTVFSGLDAWLTARRSANLEGFDASYLVHVGLVLLLVLVPFLGGGGGGGGGKTDGDGKGGYQVTWVDDPKTIDGWNPGSEGKGDGKGPQQKEQRDTPQGDDGKGTETTDGTETDKTTDLPTDPNGIPIPQQPSKQQQKKQGQHEKPQDPKRSGDENKTTEGATKSYNDYLSGRLHEPEHEKYFNNVAADIWTIVHYRIAADGSLLEVSIVETNGTQRDAQWAVDSIRSLVPLKPLPEGVKAIDITELFWKSDSCQVPPGSLAEKLRRLPDGRFIKVEH